MLLEATQEWEVVAHKGISLAVPIQMITKLIISWRKMELHCWKGLCDVQIKRYEYFFAASLRFFL